MSFLLFSLTILAFVYFFYAIGTRPIAIFCLLVLIGFIGNTIGGDTIKQSKQQLTELIQTNGLIIARILLVIGCGIVLMYFGVQIETIIITFLFVHLGLRILTHFGLYNDGKKIFGTSYVLLLIGSIGRLWYVSKETITITKGEGFWWNGTFLSTILPLILSLIPFHLGVYGFLTFIGVCVGKNNQKVQQITYMLFHLTIMIAILATTKNITLFRLLIAQTYLTGIYYITYYFHHTTPQEKKISLTAEDILAGKKVFDYIEQKKKEPDLSRRNAMKSFITHIPHRINSILYIGNIGLIFIVMVLYIKTRTTNTWLIQIFYWLSISIFLINFFLIKKTPKKLNIIHRFSGFIIINFAVYTNIIFVVGSGNRNILTFVGIIRNYLNHLIITKIETLVEKGFLLQKDYRCRIWVNVIGMLLNCFFLTKTTLPGQLIFALICVYLGSFGFLTYYNIKYVYDKVYDKEK